MTRFFLSVVLLLVPVTSSAQLLPSAPANLTTNELGGSGSGFVRGDLYFELIQQAYGSGRFFGHAKPIPNMQVELVDTCDDESLSERTFANSDGQFSFNKPEVAAALFTIENRGDVFPEVVKSKKDFHLVQLASVLRPPKTRLEDVDAMVRARIRKERLNAVLEGK